MQQEMDAEAQKRLAAQQNLKPADLELLAAVQKTLVQLLQQALAHEFHHTECWQPLCQPQLCAFRVSFGRGGVQGV